MTRARAARTTGGDSGATAVPAGRLLAAVFLVALNLRAPLAGLPPLVPRIERDLGLGGSGAGLLTALPVLCMGLFAPVAQRLGHRLGREGAVAAALALLAVGALLRVGHAAPELYAGTLLVGVGIAVCGTVLPGIVKEFFADRPGATTGVYMLAMMVGATAAAALAVPVADRLGSWELSLGAWTVPAVVALAAWLPVVRQVGRHDDTGRDDPSDDPAGTPNSPGPLPWRSATAWAVAGYLVAQSCEFYSQLAWIAPFYESRGWSPSTAGLLLSLFSVAQMVGGVGVPVLADRTRDRRPLIGGVVGITLVGLAGVLLLPGPAALWVVLLGLGGGGGFALGLVLLVDYAASPAAAARLTAMAFLVGYGVASLGPFAFGALRDASGGFALPWAVLLALAVVQLTTVRRLRPDRQLVA